MINKHNKQVRQLIKLKQALQKVEYIKDYYATLDNVEKEIVRTKSLTKGRRKRISND